MKPFKIVDVVRVLDAPFAKIDEHNVVFPNGKKAKWWVRQSPDAVVVLPVLADGKVLLQRTYKHGCGQVVTEVCAGMVDEGEAPLDAAKRELREETGYTATRWTAIGTTWVNPTSTPMKYHFYLAEGAELTHKTHPDDSEQIEPFTVDDFAAAQKLLTTQSDQNCVTCLAAIALAQTHIA